MQPEKHEIDYFPNSYLQNESHGHSGNLGVKSQPVKGSEVSTPQALVKLAEYKDIISITISNVSTSKTNDSDSTFISGNHPEAVV